MIEKAHYEKTREMRKRCGINRFLLKRLLCRSKCYAVRGRHTVIIHFRCCFLFSALVFFRKRPLDRGAHTSFPPETLGPDPLLHAVVLHGRLPPPPPVSKSSSFTSSSPPTSTAPAPSSPSHPPASSSALHSPLIPNPTASIIILPFRLHFPPQPQWAATVAFSHIPSCPAPLVAIS